MVWVTAMSEKTKWVAAFGADGKPFAASVEVTQCEAGDPRFCDTQDQALGLLRKEAWYAVERSRRQLKDAIARYDLVVRLEKPCHS